MAQALAPKHAMKMGYRRHGRIWREIGRHEHGMDRKPRRDDGPPARSSPHIQRQRRSMKISTHLASAALSVVMLTATAFLPASAHQARRCRSKWPVAAMPENSRRACRQAAGDERLPEGQQGKTLRALPQGRGSAAAEHRKGLIRAQDPSAGSRLKMWITITNPGDDDK